MRRGTLGESDTDQEISNSDDTSRPIINPYDQPSTSRQAAVFQNSRIQYTARKSTSRRQEISKRGRPVGAARRKMTAPQKEQKFLKEIHKLQKITHPMIPKAPFGRLIREISMSCNAEITRYTETALAALQEATEMFLSQVLTDSYLLTLHRKRITLSVTDMQLLRSLKIGF